MLTTLFMIGITSQFNLIANGSFDRKFEQLPSNWSGHVTHTAFGSEVQNFFRVNDSPFMQDDGLRPHTEVTSSFFFYQGFLEEVDYSVQVEGSYRFSLFNHYVPFSITVEDFQSGVSFEIPCFFTGPYNGTDLGSVDLTRHAMSHWGHVAVQRINEVGWMISGYSHSNVVDTTLDGIVDSNDLFMFIDWMVSSDPRADLNQDRMVDSMDFFEYLYRFFQ